MTPGIDPKVDYAFKFLFGNERNPLPLIGLLNAILKPAPGEQIVEVQILNPFNEKMALDEKLSILDIKARDQLGRLFNIEMQMVLPPGLRQRILYYWSKLYTGQLQSGQDYKLLRPAISVCFVDGVLFPEVPEHHLEFRLVDVAEGVTLTEDLTIHFFELPKFRLRAEELATPLDAWVYFLRNAERLDLEEMPELLDTAEIRQAMEALMELVEVDIQKEIYEGRLKAQRDQQMFLRATTIDREQLLAEGRSEGLAEGRSEGLKEGVARGILIGRIELLQKLLRREATPREELEAMPLAGLEARAAQLEKEVAGS